MRLFLAVSLDDHARASLSRSVADLRAYLQHAQPEGARAVKWVETRNLHLTLHFLGEVDDRRVPGLVAALEEPFPMAPFDLAFGGWGVFPPKGPARVIWTGVTGGEPALITLHRLAAERLAGQGLAIEQRPLAPHLTVGRVKDPTPVSWRDARSGTQKAPSR